MTDTHTLRKGWAQALFSVLVLWGVNNVMLGFSAQILHTNYLIYTCASFISCAFFLLLFGGKGPLVKETLRSIDTWAFGFIMLIGYVLTLTLFSYVTSTEGSLLQRSSLLFSIAISWLLFSRKPSKGQLLGVTMVFAGIIVVCSDLPQKDRGIIYLLMFLEGLALTGRMFVAETHRPHKHAMNLQKDPRAKARVVGFVMFVISTFFLGLTALLAIMQTYAPLPIENNILPTIESFTHAPSIFAGLIAGVFLLAPLRVIEFSSAHIIKTENFLALAALSSASTYFWEWLLQPITSMTLKTFTQTDFIAGIIITFGSLIAALSSRKKDQKEAWKKYLYVETQDIDAVADSREIIASTFEHFEGKIEPIAKNLDLTKETINAILNDKDKILAFKPEVLKDVARAYRRNVAGADALTGLANRSTFMQALKNAPIEADIYSVLFIDLNKFKPVNDTYGHEAGDAILRGVAERLNALFPTRALNCRLGGDEYAILLLDADKETAQGHIDRITTALSTPFEINNTTIEIGAAVGVASAPEDSTDGETLLKLADESMYQDKGEATR